MKGKKILDVENKYFSAHADEFTKKYPGQFLLIKGEVLHGHYSTLNLAIEEGVTKFGAGPFLVRNTEETNPMTLSAPALAVGVPLVADP